MALNATLALYTGSKAVMYRIDNYLLESVSFGKLLLQQTRVLANTDSGSYEIMIIEQIGVQKLNFHTIIYNNI